jgi:L-amino acid N-acyltransferase YncA
MFAIRAAEPSDAGAIARIYVDAWRDTYAGLLAEEFLVGLDADGRERRWWRHALARRGGRHAAFVAEAGEDGVVGFVSGGRARDRRLDYDGEVYTLYLRHDHHGVGLGKRLFTTMAAQLVQVRGPSLIVWVLAGNPARYFYEALGAKCVARRPGTMGGAPIEEIGFAWDDARALVALGRPGQDGQDGQDGRDGSTDRA